MSTDGYLKIKTKIDNSDIPKGVKELEDKIKKAQTDNSNNSQEERNLENEIDSYKRLQNQADTYKQKLNQLKAEKNKIQQNNPGLSVGQDSKELANIKFQIDSINQKYKQITSEIDKQSPKIDRVYAKLNKIKQKQTENNAKIFEYKKKIEAIKTKHIENSLNGAGKAISKQISQLGRMALGIVGISTAWGMVRSAVNLVSQYNTQVSTNLEYMRYVIANAILPIVQKLIGLAMTLLSYVNLLANAWFGINLFSNSSAKNFQKMQKSASGTAKQMKEISNSTQSFDEMNIVSDNSNTNASGGLSVPSVDLNGTQGPIPEWLKWIIDNKDLIMQIFTGILAGIVAMKLGLTEIKSLGIGVLIAGIVGTIKSLINYFNDPSWENFGKIISNIGLILLGVGIIIGSVPLAIAGVAIAIVGIIVSHWEKIKEFLQKGIDWLISKTDWIREQFGIIGEFIYLTFTDLLQTLLDMFDGIFKGVKKILDGIFLVFKGIFTGDMKKVLEGFKLIFKGVFDSLWAIAKAPLNWIIKGINHLIDGANSIKFDIPHWIPSIGGKQFGFNIPKIPLLAKGTVVRGPTPAIIGEAGAEAVMPLENNLEYLDYIADKIASKIGGNGSSYVIVIDSKVVQRGIAKRDKELAFAKNGG